MVPKEFYHNKGLITLTVITLSSFLPLYFTAIQMKRNYHFDHIKQLPLYLINLFTAIQMKRTRRGSPASLHPPPEVVILVAAPPFALAASTATLTWANVFRRSASPTSTVWATADSPSGSNVATACACLHKTFIRKLFWSNSILKVFSRIQRNLPDNKLFIVFFVC